MNGRSRVGRQAGLKLDMLCPDRVDVAFMSGCKAQMTLIIIRQDPGSLNASLNTKPLIDLIIPMLAPVYNVWTL